MNKHRRGRKVGKLLRLLRCVRNWPRTLADHLRFSRSEYVCEMRDGSRILVRGGTDDRHVVFEVFVERIYAVSVGPGDVVIDIGAHIGCFTVWAARQGARVFSFEPLPENFDALKRNTLLNCLSDVVHHRVAVGKGDNTRRLVLPDNAAYTGRCSLYPGRGTNFVEVTC